MQDQPHSAAEELFHDGNRRLGAGDFEGAEHCFREAIRLVPDFYQAHANLGFALDRMGDLPQAEACYRQALRLALDCTDIHLNLGALLASQKRFEHAQVAYADAIDSNPAVPAVWSNLGRFTSP